MFHIKTLLRCMFAPKFTKNKAEDVPYDHVIQIDGFEGSGCPQVTSTPCSNADKQQRRCKTNLIVEILFCAMVTFLWVTALSFFVRFATTSMEDKNTVHDYFYFSYFVIVLVVTVIGIYFETLILKGFEKFSPKIAIIVKKNQRRVSEIPFILRMRVADQDDQEFIETEIAERELTYDKVLELCCQELELGREQVVRIRKIPNIKIRNDADVKRFLHVEHLEVITC